MGGFDGLSKYSVRGWEQKPFYPLNSMTPFLLDPSEFPQQKTIDP